MRRERERREWQRRQEGIRRERGRRHQRLRRVAVGELFGAYKQ